MASMLYKNSPTRGRWRGAYVKGNLEIHSSDLGGYSYRYCDNPRSAELHVREVRGQGLEVRGQGLEVRGQGLEVRGQRSASLMGIISQRAERQKTLDFRPQTLDLRLQTFNRPSNLETFKPRNLQTQKPSNLETFKPRNLQTQKPSNLTTLLYNKKKISHRAILWEICIYPYHLHNVICTLFAEAHQAKAFVHCTW